MKLFINLRLPAWLLLAAVLGTASGCAGHSSFQKKTRSYKNRTRWSSPCPCGH